jgi:NADH-quinone oxidoreductase E subunit
MKMTTETRKELTPEILELIETYKTREHPDSYLIAVLHKVQEEFGYLSREHLDQVAYLLGIPTSYVFGVATFYHFFRLQPQGKYAISVCLGTACFVKGADRVLQTFKDELGIDMGETTKDGLFSLTNTRCLGVCGLAPVVTINGKVFSQVTPNQVPEILNRFRSEHEKENEPEEENE